MLVVGIAGGTGSGKTTVVRKIRALLSNREVAVLSQDAYYMDNSHIPKEDRVNINFDHPQSIEWPLLVEHIEDLRTGRDVKMPIYSYLTCSRSDEHVLVESEQVLIVEGILIFNSKALRDLCDIKIFVDAAADDRLVRVIQRDMAERGRTAVDVLERYEKTVKPMHEQFIEPTKRFADIIIPQGGQNLVAIDVLASMIRMKLSDNAIKN